jgi:hypothetical protein
MYDFKTQKIDFVILLNTFPEISCQIISLIPADHNCVHL